MCIDFYVYLSPNPRLPLELGTIYIIYIDRPYPNNEFNALYEQRISRSVCRLTVAIASLNGTYHDRSEDISWKANEGLALDIL